MKKALKIIDEKIKRLQYDLEEYVQELNNAEAANRCYSQIECLKELKRELISIECQ